MSSHLEKYLEGTVRSAYGAIGGSGMKYDKLKAKLLMWFEAQTIDRKDKVRENFSNLSMKPGETCAIYCLRIEQMALKAFKDSPMEMEHQLKKKLRDTAPPNLIYQIDTAESIFSITDVGGLTWRRIKKMAEQHDRKQMKGELIRKTEDEQLSLFYSHTDDKNEVPRKSWNSGYPLSPPRQQRVHWNNEKIPSPPSRYFRRPRQNSGRMPQQKGSSRVLRCRQCGKSGHTEPNCWGKQNRCFACGSREHWKVNCPLRTDRFENGNRLPSQVEDQEVDFHCANDEMRNLN